MENRRTKGKNGGLKRNRKFALTILLAAKWLALVAMAAPFGEFNAVSINGANGSSRNSNGVFHLSSSGTNDGIVFVCQPFSWNGVITARVRRTAKTPKVGVLFRQNTNTASVSAGMFLDASNTIFERRLVTSQPAIVTTRTNETWEWLRVVREGDALGGFYSADGTNWTQISADTIEMPENIYAGFAISGTGEADVKGVRMTSARLVSPSAKNNFIAPTNVVLETETESMGGKIKQVEFFAGTGKIGEVSAPPFSYLWTNSLAGDYSMTAKITDNSGSEFFTEPVSCDIALPKARAIFLPVDENTKGDWKGIYGNDGFVIPNDSTNIPIYLKTDSIRYPSHTWGDPAASERTALKRANSDKRVGTHWYSKQAQAFILDLTFADGNPHRVSFYFMDWDQRERVFEVQAMDGSSKLLAAQKIGGFSNGKYLSCSVLGRVIFKIVRNSEGSMILNGLFFDPEPSQSN